MKYFTTYDSIPKNAAYLGSEHGDGSSSECLDDSINEAVSLACFRDADGVRHYFDLVD
jgi:hypothetical protein